MTCLRSGLNRPFRVLQKPERAPIRALRTSSSGRFNFQTSHFLIKRTSFALSHFIVLLMSVNGSPELYAFICIIIWIQMQHIINLLLALLVGQLGHTWVFIYMFKFAVLWPFEIYYFSSSIVWGHWGLSSLPLEVRYPI